MEGHAEPVPAWLKPGSWPKEPDAIEPVGDLKAPREIEGRVPPDLREGDSCIP